MQDTVYHTLLRISALTLALVLLFVSGVVSPVTSMISHNTGVYLANTIGMNAAVLPNEFNTLNSELEEKKKSLEAREIAVSLKEQETQTSETTNFLLSAMLFALLVLIVTNYVLDYLRAHPRQLINPMRNEKVV
jgi:predicted PurR-regulated permease PerM